MFIKSIINVFKSHLKIYKLFLFIEMSKITWVKQGLIVFKVLEKCIKKYLILKLNYIINIIISRD